MSQTAIRTTQVIDLDEAITLTLTPVAGRRWDARLTWGPSLLGWLPGTTREDAARWARARLRAVRRPLAEWPHELLLEVFVPEVRRRGGDTAIGDGRHNRSYDLRVRDVTDAAVLLHARGWYRINRRIGDVSRTIDYLAGVDDSGPWATRAVSTAWSVEGAMEALVPAEVRRRPHVRQGDVYVVRMERASATTPSGVVAGSHAWDASSRTLTHIPEPGELAHRAVTAPAGWPGARVIEQHRLGMLRNLVD